MHKDKIMHILDYLSLEIINKLGLDPETLVAPKYRKREDIYLYDLVYSVIAFPSSVEEASKNINTSKTYILAYLKQYILGKPIGRGLWSSWLLEQVQYKYCNSCSTYQSLDNFSNDKDRKSSACKECMKEYQLARRISNPEVAKQYYIDNKERIKQRVAKYYSFNKGYYQDYLKTYYITNKDSGIFREYAAKRRARKLHATPSWANLALIKEIYANAEGMHVDHIIPLQGELVCGLHVENNLQYLTPEENLAKSNKFTVE
jgi:hypothetical protein